MEDIRVTMATDAEGRACLALLPEARGRAVELLIARSRGVFAGAAAIHWQSWSKPGGFPLSIHVMPEWRGQGVGRRLLAAAADLAAEETDGFWPFLPVAEQGVEARFMLAQGFRLHGRQLYFKARIDGLLDNISPLLARLRRRTGHSNQVEIQAIPDHLYQTLGWMVSSELGGGPQSAAERMRRLAEAPDSKDRSQVAIIDGQAAGVILWRVENGEAIVDGRVVGIPWRGGPINLMLLEAGLLCGKAEGLVHVNFHCDETVKDTVSLARRAGAERTDTKATYYYPIPPT